MIFILMIINKGKYHFKNKNHWSLLIIPYLLLITHYLEYKHPEIFSHNHDLTVSRY